MGVLVSIKTSKIFLILHIICRTSKLSANWNFFATSHGKSPCDGIGGAIKRKLVHRSLAQPFQNQILTARDAYCF